MKDIERTIRICRRCRNPVWGMVTAVVFSSWIIVLLIYSTWDNNLHGSSHMSWIKTKVIVPTIDSQEENLLMLWNEMENETKRLLPNEFARTHVLSNEDDIVLVTHLGTSKFARLLFSLRQWTGPASVSVYLAFPDEIKAFVNFYRTSIESDTMLRSKVTFHLMVEKTSFIDDNYPHNFLREMALHDIPDGLLFLQVDVDVVVPSMDHYQQLRSLLLHSTTSSSSSPQSVLTMEEQIDRPTFLVFPTFDMNRNISDSELSGLPHHLTKEDVIDMYERGEIFDFVPFFPPAYGPTNYARWLGKSNDTPLSALDELYWIDYEFKFEPYVLGRKSSQLPHFWTRFRGFGRDKYSWFQECNCVGYRFAVLRDFFLFHLGHPHAIIFSRKNDLKFKRFQSYLRATYGDGTCFIEDK